MSQSPGPSISPWWALLLIPIGLLAGWGIAAIPLSAPPPAPAPAPHAAGVAVPAAPSASTPAQPSRPVETPKPVTPGPEVSSWTTSYESAVSESRRNGKPILIDFNAEWCPPCQRMKQSVFDDATLGRAVQTAVIPVSIVDRKRENGSNLSEVEMLQDRYQIEAFPTLIVLNPATGRSERKRGFGDPQATAEWIQHAAEAVR